MRFVEILSIAALLYGTRPAAADVPSDLGRGEIRCDKSGCAVGACTAAALWNDPTPVINSLRVVPYTDAGQVVGFKLYGVRAGSLAQKFGVENGDLLRTVNGMELNNPASAVALALGLREAAEITLALERRGQTFSRIVHVDRRPLAEGECPPLPPAPTPVPQPVPARPPSHDAQSLQELSRDIVCAGSRCQLKNGVALRILEDQATLLKSARIVPVVEAGRAVGFRLFAIRPSSLLHLLGMRNGDLVRRIGGYDISSPDKALEAYTALRKASQIPVELTRSGKPLTFTYEIK
jgi:type II secretory pathway component PulC